MRHFISLISWRLTHTALLTYSDGDESDADDELSPLQQHFLLQQATTWLGQDASHLRKLVARVLVPPNTLRVVKRLQRRISAK